jgi:plasmid stabilization system protein ParE
MNLEIIPAAQQDIANTANYHRTRQPGIEHEFLAEIEKAVTTIVENPLLFEQGKHGIRPCLVNRFPYADFYRLQDAATVRITLVRHHSRHPGFGMRRK